MKYLLAVVLFCLAMATMDEAPKAVTYALIACALYWCLPSSGKSSH